MGFVWAVLKSAVQYCVYSERAGGGMVRCSVRAYWLQLHVSVLCLSAVIASVWCGGLKTTSEKWYN